MAAVTATILMRLVVECDGRPVRRLGARLHAELRSAGIDVSCFSPPGFEGIYVLFKSVVLAVMPRGSSSRPPATSTGPRGELEFPLPAGVDTAYRVAAITLSSFFSPYAKGIAAQYGRHVLAMGRTPGHAPTKYTPLTVRFPGLEVAYLKPLNTEYLGIREIELAYDSILECGIKIAEPYRKLDGRFVCSIDGASYMLFRHLPGGDSLGGSGLTGSVLMDIVVDELKYWMIDPSPFARSVDFFERTCALIKDSYRNVAGIPDAERRCHVKRHVDSFLRAFESMRGTIQALPRYLAHGDLHAGNVRIDARGGYRGSIDQNLMVVSRILTLAKLSRVKECPADNDWRFSDEVFAEATRHLDFLLTGLGSIGKLLPKLRRSGHVRRDGRPREGFSRLNEAFLRSCRRYTASDLATCEHTLRLFAASGGNVACASRLRPLSPTELRASALMTRTSFVFDLVKKDRTDGSVDRALRELDGIERRHPIRQTLRGVGFGRPRGIDHVCSSVDRIFSRVPAGGQSDMEGIRGYIHDALSEIAHNVRNGVVSPWFLLKGAQTRRMRLGGQYALDTDLSPEPAGAGLVASRNSIVRICLIFGAFDPLHLGHLRMGLEGMRCGLHDVVLYCPYTDRNRSTSSKPAKSRFAHRLALATAGGTNDLFPLFRVSEIGRRSYPFEALRQFVRANLRAFPDAFFSITYKVGSDVFPVLRDRLPLLHRSILQAGNGRVDLRFVVNQRPGSEVPKKQISDSPLSNLRIEFEWCETKGQVSAVSSSAIRSSPVASCHLWPRLMRCWPLVHARYAKRNHVPNP